MNLRIQTSLDIFKCILTVQDSRVYFRHYAADCMPSFNPIMIAGYAALFSYMAVIHASDSSFEVIIFGVGVSCRILYFYGGGSGLRLNDGFRCEALNSWLKFDDCLWLDPSWFN